MRSWWKNQNQMMMMICKMLKIAPLIDLFFKGESWGARAEKIAACGYKYVETWQGKDAAVLKEMNAGGIQLISIVVNFATDAAVAPGTGECRRGTDHPRG